MRRFLGALLAGIMALSLSVSPVAATTFCSSHNNTFGWSILIHNPDGSSTSKSGYFKFAASACYDSGLSGPGWGSGFTYSIVSGNTPVVDYGPTWSNGSSYVDFIVNSHSRVTNAQGHWCQINMFPRTKFNRGAWNNNGTSSTVSNDSFLTDCDYNLHVSA